MQLNKIVAVHDFLNYAVTVVNNYNRIVATVNRGADTVLIQGRLQ